MNRPPEEATNSHAKIRKKQLFSPHLLLFIVGWPKPQNATASDFLAVDFAVASCFCCCASQVLSWDRNLLPW